MSSATQTEGRIGRFSRRALFGSASAVAVTSLLPNARRTAAANVTSNGEAFRLDSPPVLQNPTPDSMKVVWAVNAKGTGWVEYGTSRDALGHRAVCSEHGLVVLHDRYLCAHITGLTPGQTVYYRVVSVPVVFRGAYNIERGDPVASDVYRFTTPDTSTPEASFACINDTHENVQTLRALASALADEPADYLIWNGDIYNDLFNDEQIVREALRPVDAPYAAQYPVLFINGNHDVRGPEARRLALAFTPWDNEYPLGRCFAVRQGPVALIGLDTGEDKPDERPVFAGLADFEGYRRDQRDWLKKVLKREEIASAPFVVAFCHIPLNGLPGTNGGDTDQGYARWSAFSRRYWGPVLEEAGVQLVVSGHTHRFRYDDPDESRSWGQLVGGGPQPGRATLIRGHIHPDEMTVTASDIEGNELGRWSYQPRDRTA